jgi:hypothetical protein
MLTSYDVFTLTIGGLAASAVVDGVVIVTDNDDMTELEIWSSSLKTLTITGNSDLTKITGDKIVALGATAPTAAAPQTTVTINSNDLEASVAQVLTATTGAFTTNSNIGSLSAYLKLVAADVYSTAGVYYDTVQSTTSSVSVETGSTTTGQVAANAILITAPGSGGVTSGNNALVKQKRAWQLSNVAGTGVKLLIDSVEVLHDGSAYGWVTTTGNLAIDLTAIKSALATSRATTLGTTLDVAASGDVQMPNIAFSSAVASNSNGENYTNDQAAAIGAGSNNTMLTSYDVFTLTIGGLAASASITLDTSATSATGVAAAQKLVAALEAAWGGEYRTGADSATMSLFTTASATAQLNVSAKTSLSGSRGLGQTVAVTWAKATAAQVSNATAGAASSTVMDWTIGATAATDDNAGVGTALILTLTENTNLINSTNQVTVTTTTLATNRDVVELLTTKITGPTGATATSTTANIYPLDGRGDVINREAANEGTTSAVVNRTLTDRSQWTFGS